MSGHLLHATPVLSTSIDVVLCIAPEMDPSGVQVSRRGSVNWRRGVASLGVEPRFFDSSGRNPLRMVQASTAIVYELLGWPMKKFIICSQTFAHTYTLKRLLCLRAGRCRGLGGATRRSRRIECFVSSVFVRPRCTKVVLQGGRTNSLHMRKLQCGGLVRRFPPLSLSPPFFLWVNSVWAAVLECRISPHVSRTGTKLKISPQISGQRHGHRVHGRGRTGHRRLDPCRWRVGFKPDDIILFHWSWPP